MIKTIKKKNSIIADGVDLCHRKILVTSEVTDWQIGHFSIERLNG